MLDIAVTLEGWSLLKVLLLDVNCVGVMSSSRGADFLQQDGPHLPFLNLSLAVLYLLTWRVFPPHGVGLELSSRFVTVVFLMLPSCTVTLKRSTQPLHGATTI